MKRYPFPNHKAAKVLLGLGILALLYLSRSTMYTLSRLGFYKSQFLMLGVMGVIFAAFCVRNFRSWREILTDRRLIFALVCAAVLLLPMIIKRDWQLMYFTVLICVWFSIFLTFFLTAEQLGRAYVLVMTGLGAYSVLANYGLRLLADRGILRFPVFLNLQGFEFYDFFLGCGGVSYISYRNFGIFREPGVYQFFLLLALYLTFYKLTWRKPWKQWLCGCLLALTLLTTFTTGGVACLGLFALVLFFDKKLYRDKRIVALVLALIVLLSLLVAYSIVRENRLREALYEMVVAKFVNRQDSYVERTEAIYVDASFFLHSPIWGSRFADVLHAVENNTSSTLVQFAVYGILGGWLHLLCWYIFVWDKERKLWVNLSLSLIFLISFNTQNLTTDLFFWLLPVMALTERVIPGLERRREERHGS